MRYIFALFAIYMVVSLALRTNPRSSPERQTIAGPASPELAPWKGGEPTAPEVVEKPKAEEAEDCLRCALEQVVFIKTNLGFGSGVVVRADGWIVTNFHVVAGVHSAEVKLRDGRVFPVTGFSKADPDLDSVFLKVEATDLRAAKWPDGPFAETDKVFSMGAPQGLAWTATDGIISRMLPIAGSRAVLIQHTADIAPGSSGGALLNARAELIGLNTLRNRTMARTYYAVSAEHLRELMRELPGAGEESALISLPGWHGNASAVSRLLDETIEKHTER